MSKQLKLDSFLKVKPKASARKQYTLDLSKTPRTKREKQKRNYKDISTTKTTEPFWWKDSFKNFLKVEQKINNHEENGTVSWTKKYISKSNWNSPVIFDNKNLKEKEKKEVVHKTTLSTKVLKEGEIIRSRKILLRPTAKQKKIIQHWMRITRFVYNLTCKFVKKNGIKDPKFKKLKAILLDKELNPDSSKYPWLFDTELKNCPRDAKDAAIQEFVTSFHSAKESIKEKNKKKQLNSKKKTKPTTEPEMKERNQNDHQRVIIPKSGGNPSIKWNYDKHSKDNNGFVFWPTFIGKIKVKQQRELRRLSEIIPSKSSDYSAVLKYESPGKYYMIVIFKTEIQKRENNQKIIALDPGIRCFQTGFSNNGDFEEFGKQDVSRLFKETLACDKLQSQIDTSKSTEKHSALEKKKLKNKRKRLKKKYKLHQNRVQGLKQSFHKSLAFELCQNYDHILISKFKVSGMIKKHERKIKCETVRKMLNWSHFSFRKRLIDHSEKIANRVHEVSEHYTSCTCGNCGLINWNLNGNETFYCEQCEFNVPRDYNGSRNIFLMNVENNIGYATQVCIGPNSTETLNNFDSNVSLDSF